MCYCESRIWYWEILFSLVYWLVRDVKKTVTMDSWSIYCYRLHNYYYYVFHEWQDFVTRWNLGCAKICGKSVISFTTLMMISIGIATLKKTCLFFMHGTSLWKITFPQTGIIFQGTCTGRITHINSHIWKAVDPFLCTQTQVRCKLSI